MPGVALLGVPELGLIPVYLTDLSMHGEGRGGGGGRVCRESRGLCWGGKVKIPFKPLCVSVDSHKIVANTDLGFCFVGIFSFSPFGVRNRIQVLHH